MASLSHIIFLPSRSPRLLLALSRARALFLSSMRARHPHSFSLTCSRIRLFSPSHAPLFSLSLFCSLILSVSHSLSLSNLFPLSFISSLALSISLPISPASRHPFLPTTLTRVSHDSHEYVCDSFRLQRDHWHYYGVVTISRLFETVGLFCKRALSMRRYSAKETYNFREPTSRSYPILLLI